MLELKGVVPQNFIFGKEVVYVALIRYNCVTGFKYCFINKNLIFTRGPWSPNSCRHVSTNLVPCLHPFGTPVCTNLVPY